jgi:hypothetical protein
MRKWTTLLTMALTVSLCCVSHGAFIIEVDNDGDNTNELNSDPGFDLGPGTVVVSVSGFPGSPADPVGTTPGGSTVFGGGAVLPDLDQYVWSYRPSIDGDNLALAAGTDLSPRTNSAGDKFQTNFALGTTNGDPGDYNVYVAFPDSTNVSGGPTQYEIRTAVDTATFSLNQNDTIDGFSGEILEAVGDQWIKIGTVAYDGTGSIVVTQTPDPNNLPTPNTFVSMRGQAVLFEVVPEPASASLFGLALLSLLGIRRRIFG